MAAANQPNESVPRGGVPSDLLDQLHQANEKFSRARQHLEEAFRAEVNPFIERARAAHEIQDAERDIETVEEHIEEKLKKGDAQ